ncbi:MAG: TonB-dependent receptor [Burkholderiaceae bacterium]|nr:TonB-dependent receptor [Burkholderiaceae bacterium]
MIQAKQTMLVRSLALAFAGSATFVALPAFAADDDVQTIQVTAQSRQQMAKDVPITMQVVTIKDIEAVGANDMADLNGYIPGFSADDSRPTEPTFTIRGVEGGGDFGIGTDSPVGIYEDGIYTGKTGGALMNFIDVSRVEVIKGPQGTLFGRNSAAGAISVTTNEPTQDIDLLAHWRVGSFGTDRVDAMVNLPISDTSATRFVFVRNYSDGWVTNQTDGVKMGGKDDWAARLSFKQTFGAVKLNLAWEHEELDQNGEPTFGVITNPALPRAAGASVFTPMGTLSSSYIANFSNPLNRSLDDDTDGLEKRIFDGVTMRIEAPLANNITFNSTTGFRKFSTVDATDNGGTDFADAKLDTLDAKKSRSWQQEFKLSGKNDQLDWISGLSFYRNDETQVTGAETNTATIDTLNLLGGGSPANTFGALFGAMGAGGIPGVSASTAMPWAEYVYPETLTQSWSLYGDTIWHLDSATNLTAGLRYSDDKKTMTWYTPGRQSSQLNTFLSEFGGLVPASLGGPFTPASFPSNILFFGASQYSSTPVSSSKDWTNLSPRLVLDHKVDKNTMVYASVSQGYQAGGFNVFSPPVPNSPVATLRDADFAPEKMTNYETGAKMTFPELKASLNASLFAYRFNNLQNITLSGTPGTIPTYNITTSDQKATGLDLDGRIKPMKNVTLFGSLEYIDQTYTKYQQIGATGVVADLSGQPVGTPLLTAMAGANVVWDTMGGHGTWTFQGTHTSAQRYCGGNTSVLPQCLSLPNIETGAATTKFDSRLGWENEDRRYGVALIVNNVFNQRYVAYVGGQLSVIGMPYSTITPPRFVGLEFKASM